MAKVIEEFKNNAIPLEDELRNRMREERGYFHTAYVNEIEKVLYECKSKIGAEQYASYVKIAVAHHNFDPYFDGEMIAIGSIDLRRLLKKYSFNSILHGHIHKAVCPPSHPDYALAIPCPSFSGKSSEQANGLSLMRIDPRTQTFMKIQIHSVQEGRFKEEPDFDLLK